MVEKDANTQSQEANNEGAESKQLKETETKGLVDLSNKEEAPVVKQESSLDSSTSRVEKAKEALRGVSGSFENMSIGEKPATSSKEMQEKARPSDSRAAALEKVAADLPRAIAAGPSETAKWAAEFGSTASNLRGTELPIDGNKIVQQLEQAGYKTETVVDAPGSRNSQESLARYIVGRQMDALSSGSANELVIFDNAELQSWDKAAKIDPSIKGVVYAHAGSSFNEVASEAITKAEERSGKIAFEFNGTIVSANPGDSADKIYKDYQAGLKEKADAYRNSPEGIAAREASEKAHAEEQRVAKEVYDKLPETMKQYVEQGPSEERGLRRSIAAGLDWIQKNPGSKPEWGTGDMGAEPKNDAARQVEQIMERAYNGHSGYSFNWSVRQVEAFQQAGMDKFNEFVKAESEGRTLDLSAAEKTTSTERPIAEEKRSATEIYNNLPENMKQYVEQGGMERTLRTSIAAGLDWLQKNPDAKPEWTRTRMGYQPQNEAARQVEQIMERAYNGHSGSSFSWSVGQVQHFHKEGMDKFNEFVKAESQDPRLAADMPEKLAAQDRSMAEEKRSAAEIYDKLPENMKKYVEQGGTERGLRSSVAAGLDWWQRNPDAKPEWTKGSLGYQPNNEAARQIEQVMERAFNGHSGASFNWALAQVQGFHKEGMDKFNEFVKAEGETKEAPAEKYAEDKRTAKEIYNQLPENLKQYVQQGGAEKDLRSSVAAGLDWLQKNPGAKPEWTEGRLGAQPKNEAARQIEQIMEKAFNGHSGASFNWALAQVRGFDAAGPDKFNEFVKAESEGRKIDVTSNEKAGLMSRLRDAVNSTMDSLRGKLPPLDAERVKSLASQYVEQGRGLEVGPRKSIAAALEWMAANPDAAPKWGMSATGDRSMIAKNDAARQLEAVMDRAYGGHSGASFGWAVREALSIQAEGLDKFASHIKEDAQRLQQEIASGEQARKEGRLSQKGLDVRGMGPEELKTVIEPLKMGGVQERRAYDRLNSMLTEIKQASDGSNPALSEKYAKQGGTERALSDIRSMIDSEAMIQDLKHERALSAIQQGSPRTLDLASMSLPQIRQEIARSGLEQSDPEKYKQLMAEITQVEQVSNNKDASRAQIEAKRSNLEAKLAGAGVLGAMLMVGTAAAQAATTRLKNKE
jgi:AcrR family transcriptional regulator